MKQRPISLLGTIVALAVGALFFLLSLPFAIRSIWRMARRGWK